MPLYEYSCHQCGATFEVRQKFSDEPLKTHEGCGGDVDRLLSPPALQFKGTGWYVTDYAHKNGSSPSNGSSGDSKNGNGSEKKSDSGAKAESKTETKPASKQ